MANVQKSIDLIIKENPITIFSKSYCPYCTRAKNFIQDKLSQPPFTIEKNSNTTITHSKIIKVIELDLMSSSSSPSPKNSTQDEVSLENISGENLQAGIAEKLGKSKITVPQIFIKEQHIGGCDDLMALDKRGELDLILAKIATSTA